MSRSFQAIPERLDVPSAELVRRLGLPAPGPVAPRVLIGCREWLALPELGVFSLHAKTDSGARSSSLHAEDVEFIDEKSRVRFTTFDHRGQPISCEMPVARFGHVRSSTGVATRRVFIRTIARLCGGLEWQIELSLADRSEMLCPILLGRRALAGYFLIDPKWKYLLGPRRQLEDECGAAR